MLVSPVTQSPAVIGFWIRVSIGETYDNRGVFEKYQIVIPQSARETLHLKPGWKVDVLVCEGQLEFVPEGVTVIQQQP
ncbi:MAG TPA: AbrB/MazE/SpoVT family DNA-binding domain-containing protein [Gammaproteobacteria bacterium]|nr:AbrB/MazE/SpoVT family DNA-binding domain-containing protein [Gammaproteobacteria bacterium]